MSISEQVKELRELADYWKMNGMEPQNAIRKAADTIESLSAKLEDMEQLNKWYDKTNAKEIMTLSEAIEHLNDVLQPDNSWECEECKNEHIQLREWLLELKATREQSAEDCGGRWIYCGDGKNLPEEHDSIFAESKGTGKWHESMFEKTSNTVIVTVEDKKGQRATTTARTLDGKWKVDSFAKLTVVAWQPLPEEYHG